MNGQSLAKAYYLTYGKNMIESEYPEYVDRIAVGLVGDGSEAFGYDDEISRDHDFGPKFCMWLTDEDYDRIGDDLNRRYHELPDGFEGFSRQGNMVHSAGRHGVRRISEFYATYTGSPEGPVEWRDWFRVPTHLFAACTNGVVFRDPLGEFTRIRSHLQNGMPMDVRRKKLAAKVFAMAQSGQYNFVRCLGHHEPAAAQMALYEFVKACVETIYLLNNAHCPYYKWMFRGLRNLPLLSNLEKPLRELLVDSADDAMKVFEKIEYISTRVGKELVRLGYSGLTCDYLEPHAYEIQNSIEDEEIRALPISFG